MSKRNDIYYSHACASQAEQNQTNLSLSILEFRTAHWTKITSPPITNDRVTFLEILATLSSSKTCVKII